jgi:hypothetical protein
MTITTNISKALLDITGEPRPEIAILELLKDAVEHRIEKIEVEIRKFEQKYRMQFPMFKEKFEKKEVPDSYRYDVETDYLEWEGLMSRLSKYKSSLNSLA